MKTIEERAKQAGVVSQVRSDYPYDKRSVEFGYTQGATEQKAIDIEKASEWFRRNAEEYFEISIKYGDTSIELSRKFFDDFRKSMEE